MGLWQRLQNLESRGTDALAGVVAASGGVGAALSQRTGAIEQPARENKWGAPIAFLFLALGAVVGHKLHEDAEKTARRRQIEAAVGNLVTVGRERDAIALLTTELRADLIKFARASGVSEEAAEDAAQEVLGERAVEKIRKLMEGDGSRSIEQLLKYEVRDRARAIEAKQKQMVTGTPRETVREEIVATPLTIIDPASGGKTVLQPRVAGDKIQYVDPSGRVVREIDRYRVTKQRVAHRVAPEIAPRGAEGGETVSLIEQGKQVETFVPVEDAALHAAAEGASVEGAEVERSLAGPIAVIAPALKGGREAAVQKIATGLIRGRGMKRERAEVEATRTYAEAMKSVTEAKRSMVAEGSGILPARGDITRYAYVQNMIADMRQRAMTAAQRGNIARAEALADAADKRESLLFQTKSPQEREAIRRAALVELSRETTTRRRAVIGDWLQKLWRDVRGGKTEEVERDRRKLEQFGMEDVPSSERSIKRALAERGLARMAVPVDLEDLRRRVDRTRRDVEAKKAVLDDASRAVAAFESKNKRKIQAPSTMLSAVSNKDPRRYEYRLWENLHNARTALERSSAELEARAAALAEAEGAKPK